MKETEKEEEEEIKEEEEEREYEQCTKSVMLIYTAHSPHHTTHNSIHNRQQNTTRSLTQLSLRMPGRSSEGSCGLRCCQRTRSHTPCVSASSPC